MDEQNFIVYRINSRNEIVFVNEQWDCVASADGNTHLLGQKILGLSLLNFISNLPTKDLYKDIINAVRAGRSAKFNYRCDTPKARRLMEMRITLFDNDQVQFANKIVSFEERPFQRLFSIDTPRSENFITACGWCKKVNVARDVWLEVEDAVKAMRLFEGEKLPLVSHGICQDCYGPWMQEVNDAKIKLRAQFKQP